MGTTWEVPPSSRPGKKKREGLSLRAGTQLAAQGGGGGRGGEVEGGEAEGGGGEPEKCDIAILSFFGDKIRGEKKRDNVTVTSGISWGSELES